MYCTQEDIESAWTSAAVLAAVDDDENGSLSTTELAVVQRAIQRAANRMNASLLVRYAESELTGNSWCRDCNAMLAVYLLATRRGAPAPDQIQEQYEAYLDDLEEILASRKCVPGVVSLFEHRPTTTNFRFNGGDALSPIERVPETSTGSPPPNMR
jgi:phage gp36-like protein